MAALAATGGVGIATAGLAAEDFALGASLLRHWGSLVGAAQIGVLFDRLDQLVGTWETVWTYGCADTVGLVGTIINGVVALGNAVVEVCAADHCESCDGIEENGS